MENLSGRLPSGSFGSGGSGRWDRPRRQPCETLEQVHEQMQDAGLEASELIVGVDFTKSNVWTGKTSFEGKCLHDVNGPINPYLEALNFISKRLNVYDDDHKIPCYGFGDVTTGDKAVFSFFRGSEPAMGVEALAERYHRIAPLVRLSGPTSFAPLIRQAMRDVYNNDMKFHILLILADGQISEECLEETKKAIIDACAFPLSIVMIGVGDGPWGDMTHFDDELRGRKWDNFHFFEFNNIIKGPVASATQRRQEDSFEQHVLEELPEQFETARTLTGVANKTRVTHIINAIPPSTVVNPPTHFG